MRFYVIFLIAIYFLPIAPSQAREIQKDVEPGLERWYYQMSFGFNSSSLSGDLGDTMNRIGDLTRTSRSSNSVNMIGIFLPVNDNLLIGTKLFSGGWVSYGSDDQVNLYLSTLSVQYFFDTVGNGAFVIGDIGKAEILYTDSTVGIRDISDSGLGARFGVGYARPISSETRLFLSLTNTFYKFNAGSVNSLGVNTGVIW